MTEAEFVNAAMSFRYKQPPHECRGPLFYDCWGLALAVANFVGVSVPRDPFRTGSDAAAVAAVFNEEVKPHEWRECEPVSGAIAFFGKGKARHAGAVIAGGVLDISKSRGVRFTKLQHPKLNIVRYALWAA